MGGARFWRAGMFGVAAVCGLLATPAWTRQTWVRICRQDAMTPQTLAQGAPGHRCHLCRDCIAVCPQQALSVTFYGSRHGAHRAGTILAALLAGLHAAFLAVARI